MIKPGSRVRVKTNDEWNGNKGDVWYQDETVAPCRETTWAVMMTTGPRKGALDLFEAHELEEL